jgi:hypothetical protein
MKDKVISRLEQLKAARLKRERGELLRSRMFILENLVKEYTSTQPRTKPLPKAVDIAALEPFYSLIFSPMDIILEEFKSNVIGFQTELTDLCDKWVKSSSELLVRLLPKSFATNPDLHLATIFFRCRWCREPISYPRVLKHECLTMNHSRTSDESDDELLQASNLYHPWNYGGEQVTFHEEGHLCAKEIISVCGQDPDSITLSEMDDLDYRVECLHCAHPSRGRLVMKWKTAVRMNL